MVRGMLSDAELSLARDGVGKNGQTPGDNYRGVAIANIRQKLRMLEHELTLLQETDLADFGRELDRIGALFAPSGNMLLPKPDVVVPVTETAPEF